MELQKVLIEMELQKALIEMELQKALIEMELQKVFIEMELQKALVDMKMQVVEVVDKGNGRNGTPKHQCEWKNNVLVKNGKEIESIGTNEIKRYCGKWNYKALV